MQPSKRLIGLFPGFLGVGGVQEASRQTATALGVIANENGWRTQFLALNDPTGDGRFAWGGREVSFRGFGRAKVPFVLSAASLLHGNSCIVLAAHPNLAPPAACIKAFSRMRMIVMAHGVEVWSPLSQVRRRALLCADLVLAPSSDTAEKLVAVQGVSLQRTRRLPWVLNPDVAQMTQTPALLPLPQGFPKGSVILTVARWSASERYKGADDLIRATCQLRTAVPDLHLVVVGGGDDLPRLQKLALDIGVHDRVHFLNSLSRQELGACYAHSDVFALPSTGEGFGFVFLEAMSFGKPVVATAIGGATDLVESEVNGLLVEPHDIVQLTAALARLFASQQLRVELGRRGSEKVLRESRFDVFESGLASILKECGLGPCAA
jgi:phosphatidyl-myo-inositol dimannoside synthase